MRVLLAMRRGEKTFSALERAEGGEGPAASVPHSIRAALSVLSNEPKGVKVRAKVSSMLFTTPSFSALERAEGGEGCSSNHRPNRWAWSRFQCSRTSRRG